jgi:hypothetical protein
MSEANNITGARVVAGRQILVENKDKKTSADKWYIAIWVENADGNNEECLLFTEEQIKEARDRAKANPEDIPKKDFIADLLD